MLAPYFQQSLTAKDFHPRIKNDIHAIMSLYINTSELLKIKVFCLKWL